MKKLFVMLCAAVALFACQKVQPVTVEVTPEELPSTPMTFNLTVSQAEAGATKALKSGWEDGDVVYVFFKGFTDKYIKKTFNGTSWTDTYPGGNFVPDDFDGIDDADKLMTAVHFPYYDQAVAYNEKDYEFRIRNSVSGDLLYTYYMMAQRVSYSVSGATLSGTLNMGKPEGFVQFFVPGIAEAEAPLYHLREANGHLRPKACESVSRDGLVRTVNNDAGYALQGFAYKGGVLFAGYLTSAGTAADYSFQLVKYVSATKACAEGTYEIKGHKTINAGVVVRFPELSHAAWTCGKWVDMGPAGRWATGNLTDDGGTTKGEANIVAPDEAGKYYAWGETVGHAPSGTTFSRSFDGASYQLANGASNKLTKYCNDAWFGNEDFTDSLTELTSDDDAATKNLGSAWRMPTEAECSTLVGTDKFVWAWQTGTSDGYAIGGRLVTCHATGLSLFLPAAGYGDFSSLKLSGINGYYWASSLYTDSPINAFDLCVNSRNWFVSNDYRRYGLSVRPVYEETVSGAPGFDGLGDEETL